MDPHSLLFTVTLLVLANKTVRGVKALVRQTWWPELDSGTQTERTKLTPGVALWALHVCCGASMPKHAQTHTQIIINKNVNVYRKWKWAERLFSLICLAGTQPQAQSATALNRLCRGRCRNTKTSSSPSAPLRVWGQPRGHSLPLLPPLRVRRQHCGGWNWSTLTRVFQLLLSAKCYFSIKIVREKDVLAFPK